MQIIPTFRRFFLLTMMTALPIHPPTLQAKETKIEITQDETGSVAEQTKLIQDAIESVAKAGGGTVVFPPGRYVSGGLKLRDHVHIELQEGAVLAGSSDWKDYGDGKWDDALLSGEGLRGVRISGPGVIDGSRVTREGGEGGYRGPHTVFFKNASDIRMDNLTIRDSGNYAVLCQGVENAAFTGLTILDGHDGVHIQDCKQITITDCDFRTGNDCVAGTDNVGVTVTGSRFNTACHAFRLGVQHFVVRDCTFQGPGEYPDKWSVSQGTPRFNMLAAFIHFSPLDRNPKIPSDDWLIENCTMDQVESIYAYDHENGRWQEGQPAKRLIFRDITVTQMEDALRVAGDAKRQLDLTLENVSISLHPDHAGREVLDIRRFGRLRLQGLELVNSGDHLLIRLGEGDRLEWDKATARLAAEVEEVDRVQVMP